MATESLRGRRPDPTSDFDDSSNSRKKAKKIADILEEEEEEGEEEEPARMTMKEALKNRGGKPMKSKESGQQEEETRTSLPENPAPQVAASNTNVIAPQIQFRDGKFVVDESSLVVTANMSAGVPSEFTTVSESSAHVTSASFTKRTRSERWSKADTDKFYDALRKFGPDFSLMEALFPTRNRRQLKNKYKREEKDHAARIDETLNNRQPLDFDVVKEIQTIAAQVEAEKAQNAEPLDQDED